MAASDMREANTMTEAEARAALAAATASVAVTCHPLPCHGHPTAVRELGAERRLTTSTRITHV